MTDSKEVDKNRYQMATYSMGFNVKGWSVDVPDGKLEEIKDRWLPGFLKKVWPVKTRKESFMRNFDDAVSRHVKEHIDFLNKSVYEDGK